MRILPTFVRKFNYMFNEPDVGFKGSMTLFAHVMSVLELEPNFKKKTILKLDIISCGIYFIEKGDIAVSYKNGPVLVNLHEGSYFGDISFIFQVRNQF